MTENKRLLTEGELREQVAQYAEAGFTSISYDGALKLARYIIQAQHTKTVTKIREVVEGAGLTDEEMAQVYYTKSKPSFIDAKGHNDFAYEKTFCQAQLQAVKDALKSVA